MEDDLKVTHMQIRMFLHPKCTMLEACICIDFTNKICFLFRTAINLQFCAEIWQYCMHVPASCGSWQCMHILVHLLILRESACIWVSGLTLSVAYSVCPSLYNGETLLPYSEADRNAGSGISKAIDGCEVSCAWHGAHMWVCFLLGHYIFRIFVRVLLYLLWQ